MKDMLTLMDTDQVRHVVDNPSAVIYAAACRWRRFYEGTTKQLLVDYPSTTEIPTCLFCVAEMLERQALRWKNRTSS